MLGYNKYIAVLYKVIFAFSAGFFLFQVADNFSIFKPLLVDEAITAWLVSLPFKELIRETFLNQGTSPFYFLVLKFWLNLLGLSGTEAMKLFSLVLFFGTVSFLFLSLKKLTSTFPALLSLGILIGIKNQFTLAIMLIRPYSLVAFFLSISLYFYVRYYLEKKDRNDRASLLLPAFLGFYLATITHYFFISFWLLALGHYLYFHRNKISKKILFCNLSLFLSLLFFGPHFQQILGSVGGWAQTVASNQTSLGKTYLHLLLTIPISSTLLGLLCLISLRKFKFRDLKQKNIINYNSINFELYTFIVLSFLAVPATYFFLKEIFSIQVYLYRYYFWYVVFGIILFASLIYFLEKKIKILILIWGLILTAELNWNEHQTSYRLPNFQIASAIINQNIKSNIPVFFHPGLVETYSPKMFFDLEKRNYLLSFLSIYPIKNEQVFLLPPNLESPEFFKYYKNVIAKELSTKKELVLYTSAMETAPREGSVAIPTFYYQLFEQLGLKVKILNHDDGVAVIHVKSP